MDARLFGASVVSANQSRAERWRILSFQSSWARIGRSKSLSSDWSIFAIWIVFNFGRIRLVHEFLFSIEFVFFSAIQFCILNLDFSHLARAYQMSPDIDILSMFGSRLMCSSLINWFAENHHFHYLGSS